MWCKREGGMYGNMASDSELLLLDARRDSHR